MKRDIELLHFQFFGSFLPLFDEIRRDRHSIAFAEENIRVFLCSERLILGIIIGGFGVCLKDLLVDHRLCHLLFKGLEFKKVIREVHPVSI